MLAATLLAAFAFTAPHALTAAPASSLTVADEAADLAAARALFERNIAAIQDRDREAYLACYHASERLVRTSATGFELGFEPLAAGTAPTGDDAWPETLVARDVALTWLRPGLVYGTYRYHVVFDGAADDGISERLFALTDDGWRIAVSTAFPTPDAPPPAVALVGGTLYDGESAAPIADAVVVVRDGRIEAVGSADTVAVPDDADTIDVTGRFLVPGLIDTHVHYSQTGWADGRPDALDVRDRWPYEQAMADNEAHPERFHRAFLHSGITAVFDVGGYPWTRRLGARTELDPYAPHVSATGALFSTLDVVAAGMPILLHDASQFIAVDEEARVRAAVRAHATAGSDAIKVWFVTRGAGEVETFEPLVLAIGDEARRVGLPLVVHATSLATARVAVAAGAHLLVHSVEDVDVDDAFVAACRAGDVHYCPTLTVRAGYDRLRMCELPAELLGQLDAVHPAVAERVRATLELEPDARTRSPEFRDRIAALRDRSNAQMARNLLRLHEAGVKVVLGTDAGNPLTLHGPSVFPELEAMQAAGLSPTAVLRAATSDAASALSREDIGRLVPGAIADLLVLREDPATSASAFRALEHVMRAGLLHRRDDLRPR